MLNRSYSKSVAVAKSVARAGKRMISVIPNEDMDGIIRILNLLENSIVLIVEVSETVKHKIKQQEG